MRNEWVRTSETDPIPVDSLPDDEVGTPGRLGMTSAPGMWAESVGEDGRGTWRSTCRRSRRSTKPTFSSP